MDDPSINPFATDDGGPPVSYGTSSSAYSRPAESNPFLDEPVAAPAATYGGAYGNAYSSSTSAAAAVAAPSYTASSSAYGSAYAATSTAKAPTFTSVADDLHTVEQLRAELKRRERELEQKNDLIASLGSKLDDVERTVRVPNWPRFYPVTYHDINGDVSNPTRRRHVRAAYIIWMTTAASYMWNFILVLIAFTAGVSDYVQNNAVMAFVWQFVLILTGPFFSFFFWYRAIYNAARVEDTVPSVKYWWFFGHFAVHIIAVILCFVGIFFNNGGMISMIGAFKSSDVSAAWGFMFLTSMLLWGVISIASVLLIITVFRYYRAAGGRNPTRKDVDSAALLGASTAASAAQST